MSSLIEDETRGFLVTLENTSFFPSGFSACFKPSNLVSNSFFFFSSSFFRMFFSSSCVWLCVCFLVRYAWKRALVKFHKKRERSFSGECFFSSAFATSFSSSISWRRYSSTRKCGSCIIVRGLRMIVFLWCRALVRVLFCRARIFRGG